MNNHETLNNAKKKKKRRNVCLTKEKKNIFVRRRHQKVENANYSCFKEIFMTVAYVISALFASLSLSFSRINICVRYYQIFKNFARAVQNPNDSVHNFIND